MRVQKKIIKKLSSFLYVKPQYLRGIKPVVSFTFDDVPKSAVTTGANILNMHNASGTFYLSGGLAGSKSLDLDQFSSQDIDTLLDGGHEIGCHTYGHNRLTEMSSDEIHLSFGKNASFFHTYASERDITSFSYPFGATSRKSKVSVRSRFSTGRGIKPGINQGFVDLCELKANALYSSQMSEDMIKSLVGRVKESNGWLIFYTHAVSENPNCFGCNPALLEFAVREVIDQGVEILNVKGALARQSFTGE